MNDPHLTFLISLNDYISERLYLLANQMGPSEERDIIRGLQALTNAASVLLENTQEDSK